MRAPGPQRLPGDAGRAARGRSALRWRRWWGSAHEVEPAALPGHADSYVEVVKVIHTAAWFSIESCVAYLLYAGLSGRTDRRAAIAAGVVFGESAVFAANRFRCPLTELAQSLGPSPDPSPSCICPSGSPTTCRPSTYLCWFSSCSCTAGTCFGIERIEKGNARAAVSPAWELTMLHRADRPPLL